MKRQELKALLHGVENAGEIIDQIMEINGADIENAKKTAGGGNDAVSRENERRFGTPFSPSCLHASSPYRFLRILRTPFLTEIEFGVTIRLDRFNTSDGKTASRSKTPPFGLKTVFFAQTVIAAVRLSRRRAEIFRFIIGIVSNARKSIVQTFLFNLVKRVARRPYAALNADFQPCMPSQRNNAPLRS